MRGGGCDGRICALCLRVFAYNLRIIFACRQPAMGAWAALVAVMALAGPKPMGWAHNPTRDSCLGKHAVTHIMAQRVKRNFQLLG